MWETLDQVATDGALEFRINNPQPKEPPKPGAWGQAAEMIAAPFKGLAQGALQTARVANRVVPQQAGNPLAMSASEQDDMLREGNITPESTDRDIRRGIDAFKPDPLTSTTVSLVLQDAARLIGKATGYGLTAGPAGAVLGTGIDEGATGYMEMRDKGVDPATAAKVGAVRGVATGVGVAIPVAGNSLAQTLGLAAAGGPVSFMAEQVVTRAILESAEYPELAREHDPFDPVGLGVSILFPGVVGAAVHRARARRAAALPQGTADNVELRDAAHASYQAEQGNNHALTDSADPQARASHSKALQEASRAMNEGEPVHVTDLAVNPAKAQAVSDAVGQRLREVENELATTREPDITLMDAPAPRAGYDIEGTLRSLEGRRPLDNGTDFDGFAPELRGQAKTEQNLMIAREEFPQRMPEVIDRFRDLEATRPGAAPHDLVADVVEQMRSGAPRAAATPMDRAARLAQAAPEMAVRLDDDGSAPRTASELLTSLREERAQHQSDARAFDAAVECLIRTGP